MTRLMGDATHDMVPQLAVVNGLDIVAGYDTGSPDIQWDAADFAMFPGIPHVTIDQAYTGSPNLNATMRDVEFGAWGPGQAVDRTGWNVPRPGIYCTLRETGYGLLTTPGVLADGWRGDLWLSIPGWVPGMPLPATPGCTVVAVQNDFSNPNYDLSVVLDDTWPLSQPLEEDMGIIYWCAGGPAGPGAYLLDGGKFHHIADETDYELHASACKVVGSATGSRITAAEANAMAADYPAGSPAVTVTTATPTLTIAGTLTPQ